MTPLWTASAAVAATGGRTSGDWAAQGVSIDSRSLAPGDLFVALVGSNRDGHRFVADALARGAAAALVSRVPTETKNLDHLLLVEDTQRALEALGHAGRARTHARIAGITGSVGKTGTKEALRHVLSQQAPTHASAASHNNHWGVPLSLARMPEDVAFGVFELGMNHMGEIAALTRIARPDVAVITTVAAAHLEFFSSVEAIADAKCEIFAGLEPRGTAILNADNPHFERMRAHAERSQAGRIVTFGEHPAADWRLLDLRLSSTDGEVVASRGGQRLAYRLGMPGRHAALNSLAVLAAVEALGAEPEAAAGSLAGLRPSSGRGARRRIALAGGEALLLDESYNANPASMTAALAVLGQQEGRRIAVLGDMLELGDQGPALHAALVEPVVTAGVDLVFCCGPLMAHLNAALPSSRRGAYASDAAALGPIVREALRPGDALLIKGSLGSRMASVLEALAPPDEPEAGRDGS